MNIKDLIPYVKETRQFGHTYIHVRIRSQIHGWDGLKGSVNGRTVVATFGGYGRSLQVGGHKYKARLWYADDQKPVPSKLIDSIVAL